jgi:hypothetical protein
MPAVKPKVERERDAELQQYVESRRYGRPGVLRQERRQRLFAGRDGIADVREPVHGFGIIGFFISV